MKRLDRMAAWLIVALSLGGGGPGRSAMGDLPLLERYTLESIGQGPGRVYEIYDRSFGGGDAQSRLRLRRERRGHLLELRVWRRVLPGQVSLALLSERVEVRGYDRDDRLILSRDFAGLQRDGIHFGDSQSGTWRRVVAGIAPALWRLEVTFLGNYE